MRASFATVVVMPKRARPAAHEITYHQALELTSELVEELYEGAQRSELPEGLYITLSALALRLHNKLPGIVAEARRHGSRRPVSTSSGEADLRELGEWPPPPQPLELPAALQARVDRDRPPDASP